jgi:hypothetical protein
MQEQTVKITEVTDEIEELDDKATSLEAQLDQFEIEQEASSQAVMTDTGAASGAAKTD